MTAQLAAATTPPAPTPSRVQMLHAMAIDTWLDVGDPLAEAVVAALRSQGESLANPIPAIRRLAASGDNDCIEFLRDVETPPGWIDFDLMRLGGNMAYRHFPHYVIAITHGGLLTTFCSAEAAYILTRTNRLERNMIRRINESGELFFGILDSDQLRPGGRMWEVCLRVRLMHTMVRLSLLRTGSWPLLGTPISALQTAAGPLFFGAMILDRLRSLGASISPEEADGYYMIWRYATRLLGVPPELLGNTPAEQRALDSRIEPLSFNPDANSRRLADALLTALTTMPGTNLLSRDMHEALARKMLGDARADAMGIPSHPLTNAISNTVALSLRPYAWAQRLPAVGVTAERLGKRAARILLSNGLRGRSPDYQG